MRKSRITLYVLLVYALRIFSAMQDGLSDRAIVDGIMVGWLAWHLMGWLCRDIIQIALLYMAGKAKGFYYFKQWAIWYGLHIAINFVLHIGFYRFAANNRHLFLW